MCVTVSLAISRGRGEKKGVEVGESVLKPLNCGQLPMDVSDKERLRNTIR